MKRLALALALALTGCNSPGTPPVGGADTDNDPTAARALFDRAAIAALRGDQITHDDLMLRLAAEHPDTRHGRAARARLGGGATTSVAVAGILAAVAIPAFMKYTRRSQTAEATMNVRKLFDSAVAYYQLEDHTDIDGTPQPRRFPPTVALTPARSPCELGVDALAPAPDTWDHPTWQALNFAIDDPHRYRYEFISAGEGPDAHFTARAIGDLDCDGVLATFERVGTVDSEGNVNAGPGMFISNELE